MTVKKSQRTSKSRKHDRQKVAKIKKMARKKSQSFPFPPPPPRARQRAPFWRGRVLGGTASINTMLYMRGNRLDYDRWAEDGNEGWGFEDCLPYFRKLETVTNRHLAKDSQSIVWGVFFFT